MEKREYRKAIHFQSIQADVMLYWLMERGIFFPGTDK